MQNKFDEISLEEQALLAKIREILGEDSDEEVDEARGPPIKDIINFLKGGAQKGKDAFNNMRQGWNQVRGGGTPPPPGLPGKVGQAAAQTATTVGKNTVALGKGAADATKATASFVKNNPKLAATLGAGAMGVTAYNKAGGSEGIGKWIDDKKKDWFDFWDSPPTPGETPANDGGGGSGGAGPANDGGGGSGGAGPANDGGGGSGGAGPATQQTVPGGSGGNTTREGDGPGFERHLQRIELDHLMREISTYTDLPDAVKLTKEYVEFIKKMRNGESAPNPATNQPSSTSNQATGSNTENSPSAASQAGRVARRASDAVRNGVTDFASELLKEDVEVTRILKNSGIK
jgi:hypothetical protein